MKKITSIVLLAVSLIAHSSCKKDSISNTAPVVSTPRTPVPPALVGRWAITSISGSTVYNIPAGTTFNTNEVFLGYTIDAGGSTQEHGYVSTYQYGSSTWTKWICSGSVELNGNAISFHRAGGSYTSSRNSSATSFGPAEVYPNKSFSYVRWVIGTDSRGRTALFLYDANGTVHTYVKQ